MLWEGLFHIFLLLSVVFPSVWSPNFWSFFNVVALFTNIPLDETISICVDFCIVVHLLLPFPFLRKFSLNWWLLPQNQCLLVLMRSCTARSTALVWVALLALFWLIFSFGSQKDICFMGFLSPSFTYVGYTFYVGDTFVSFRSGNDALSFFGSARGVMVIVAGIRHGDTSSNPRRDWLHFT